MTAQIKSEIIRPFLESTINVLETMAFIKIQTGKPYIKSPGDESSGDVTGVIGMVSEKINGSMALVFPEKTILFIVNSMLSEHLTALNRDVLDCVGELTNMISGGARAGLANLNMRFEMAIPTMIQGHHHIVEHKTKGSVIVIPFETDAGAFYVEAAFSEAS